MNNIKILYIDNDSNYAQNFLALLLEQNFDVKYIQTTQKVLIECSFFNPDIIITDVYFDEIKNTSFIKKLNKATNNTPLILYTNNDDKDLLIEAISLKVEHFILKSESSQKIINILKNIEPSKETNSFEKVQNNKSYDLGKNFIFNGLQIVLDNETIIKLTPQEKSLLEILIKQKGDCVSYETLQNSLSKKTITSMDTIRTVIRKIRRKTFNEIIQNQSGIGYKVNYAFQEKNEQILLNKVQKIHSKVLVVKGNKNKVDLLAYKLAKYGMICETTCTLQEAKELVSINKYAYIVIDLNLPDGESIDFIREFEELYTTKIIVLANNRDIHYKDYLYFKGILDYIIEDKDINLLSDYIYKSILKVENNTNSNEILVIEHSKKTGEQIKDILLPREYKVDIINSLTNAVDIIKSKNYSLIIIDVNFDECFTFIQNIKNNVNKTIHFIVLTEEQRSYSIVRESYINGAAECLRKPIFAEEFILKVNQLTDTSKLIYELQKNEKLLTNYKKIVDQSAIISKANSKGIITYVNEIFCDISGYKEGELIGKPHNIIRHPDTQKDVFKEMWHTIKDKKEIWTGVIKNKAKDGHAYYVQTSIMPILDKDGEIEEFIALRNDISSLYKEKK